MRISVDVDAKQIARIQNATGIRKKSPAVQRAVEGYLQAEERKRFLRKVLDGRSDYGLTNAQVEALGVYDAD